MRSNVPNVNASLIREVRMIAQQFFRHKNFFEPRYQAPKIPALKCCFCRDVKKKPQEATEVIQGYSVCPNHASYVRGDEYTSILRAIQRFEK